MAERSANEEAVADMLRHMLGINDPSLPWPPSAYRDYAAVDPGDTLFAQMEAEGLVRCYRRAGTTSYDWFTTTSAGRALAMASFREIQYSKSKRRYLKFLDVSDCCPDLTFREFLTRPEFAESRRNA